MESKEAQAVAAQVMDGEEAIRQQQFRKRQQNVEEAFRQAQQESTSTWASIKSRFRAASESAVLKARQMFGEPKVESTVKESAAKDESSSD